MGGTTEFINASVPLIAWPHFGDQHFNAECLEKVGVAKILFNEMRLSKDVDECYAYCKEVFDAQKIHDLFKDVIEDKKYKKAMLRLNAQRRCTGGKKLAADTIERTYIAGVDHLLDKGLIEKTDKWDVWSCCCAFCWGTLILIALIYFTVQYFLLRADLEDMTV